MKRIKRTITMRRIEIVNDPAGSSGNVCPYCLSALPHPLMIPAAELEAAGRDGESELEDSEEAAIDCLPPEGPG